MICYNLLKLKIISNYLSILSSIDWVLDTDDDNRDVINDVHNIFMGGKVWAETLRSWNIINISSNIKNHYIFNILKICLKLIYLFVWEIKNDIKK